MKADWIALAAAAVMCLALVVCLATKSWLPRVAAVASGTMAVCLGIISLWTALSALENGGFEGAPASKILSRGVSRAQSPEAFWAYFTFFALPGVLLVAFPIYSGALQLAARFRSVSGIPRPSRSSKGEAGTAD